MSVFLVPPPKITTNKSQSENTELLCWPFYWVATDFSNPMLQKWPKAACWDISLTSMEYIAGNTVVVGLNMRVRLKPDALKSSGQSSAAKAYLYFEWTWCTWPFPWIFPSGFFFWSFPRFVCISKKPMDHVFFLWLGCCCSLIWKDSWV